jgi:PPM family protein phosphatase
MRKDWHLDSAGLTDVGCVRERNEDAFCVDCGNGLFAVADGMGGHPGGDVASQMAMDALRAFAEQGVRQGANAELAALEDALLGASRAIRAEGRRRLELLGMGTTVAAVWLRGGHAHVAHLGDSRVYLARGRKLVRLTRDHSVVELLLQHGEISRADAARHPARGRLSRFAGMEPLSDPDGTTVDVRAGDRLLLCTDGLWGMVGDRQMRAILAERADAESACRALVDAGLAAGGADNLTAVVVDVKANASKSIDPFNAKDARGAKGTQTPIRATNRVPTLNRIFSIGSGGVFGNFQTGAKQRDCPPAIASLAPFAPFAPSQDDPVFRLLSGGEASAGGRGQDADVRQGVAGVAAF